MLLRNQVPNLFFSKELKKLKVSQVSLFYWVCVSNQYDRYILSAKEDLKYGYKYYYDNLERCGCSAFTVAELGELLLRYFEYPVKFQMYKRDVFGSKKIHIVYDDKKFYEDTEANVRAKFLLYLLKKGEEVL